MVKITDALRSSSAVVEEQKNPNPKTSAVGDIFKVNQIWKNRSAELLINDNVCPKFQPNSSVLLKNMSKVNKVEELADVLEPKSFSKVVSKDFWNFKIQEVSICVVNTKNTTSLYDIEEELDVSLSEDVIKSRKQLQNSESYLDNVLEENLKDLNEIEDVKKAFEDTISELEAEKSRLVSSYEDRLSAAKEKREMSKQKLTSLEEAFADLHEKYAKSKKLIEDLKASEEALKNENKKCLRNLQLQEQLYEQMKNHATEQLSIANQKLEFLTVNHNTETESLKELLQTEELLKAAFRDQLQQKCFENVELVGICDELIYGL